MGRQDHCASGYPYEGGILGATKIAGAVMAKGKVEAIWEHNGERVDWTKGGQCMSGAIERTRGAVVIT